MPETVQMINHGSGTQIGNVTGNVTINASHNLSLDLTAKLDALLGLVQMRPNIETMNYDPYSIIRPVLAVGNDILLAVRSNGKALLLGNDRDKYIDASSWQNIVSVGATRDGCIGLRSDGTCVATGQHIIGNGDIFRWNNVVSIACGAFHAIALHFDGKVSACGVNTKNQCEVRVWRDIKAIACGAFHSVGLKNDGTVIAVGDNFHGQCNVASWQDIVQIAAGHTCSVGLTKQGDIVVAGISIAFADDYKSWKNIKSIVCGFHHIVALKQDGTVVSSGMQIHGEAYVGNWDNIIAVAAGFNATAGLRADGKIFVTNDNYTVYNNYVNLDIDNWRLFKCEEVIQSRFIQALEKIKSIVERMNDEILECRKLINLFSTENRDNFSDTFKYGLYSSAKAIWEMNAECESMPDLHQLIILLSGSLSAFIEKMDKIGPKDSIIFKLTAEACAEFEDYEQMFRRAKSNIAYVYNSYQNKQDKEILV